MKATNAKAGSKRGSRECRSSYLVELSLVRERSVSSPDSLAIVVHNSLALPYVIDEAE